MPVLSSAQLTEDLSEGNCWEILLHPHYSLGLVPFDYHLSNHQDGLRMTSTEEVEHKLVSYYASKAKS